MIKALTYDDINIVPKVALFKKRLGAKYKIVQPKKAHKKNILPSNGMNFLLSTNAFFISSIFSNTSFLSFTHITL